MTDNKTQPSPASVDAFLAQVQDESRRADAEALREMMQRLSGEKPVLWGSSIIGFGSYHYKYETGREGWMPRISFSPRSKEFVLYIVDGFAGREELMKRLGKHRTGKSCLYIKRLSDVDRDVLETLVSESLRYMQEHYPESH